MNETRGPAIVAEGLVKTYGSRDEAVEAMRGVDLEVHTGESFGFLGPNSARAPVTAMTANPGRILSQSRSVRMIRRYD